MSFKPGDEVFGVPIFQAIYHGAVATFGSHASLDGVQPWDEFWPDERRWKTEKPWHEIFPDQYAIEFARGVVNGQQPTVYNFKSEFAERPEFAADYRFTVDTARFYHDSLDWLFDGELLDPGEMKCAVQDDTGFCVRYVFSQEGDYDEYHAKNLGRVLHNVWRAKDGRIAAILVNWSREDSPYELKTPDVSAAGILPARSWRMVEK